MLGGSALIASAWRFSNVSFADTSLSALGCDSVHSVNLTVLPFAQGTTTASICQGDSIFLGGAWQTTSGSYLDTLTPVASCNSLLTTSLTVIVLDTAVSQSSNVLTANGTGASYQWFNCATSCISGYLTPQPNPGFIYHRFFGGYGGSG